MKFEDGWFWPDSETHMPAWIANQKNRMILNGRPAYQGKKQIALLKLCKHFRTALDIGSHVGTWTFNMAPLFNTVRCFEPMQEHRNCFVQNIEAANVVLYPIALGDKAEHVAMHTGPLSSGDTWVDPGKAGIVQMETLDSFEFADVDCVKLDCEGFEEKILRGAEQTLLRCKPVICVEQKRNFPQRYGLKPQGAIPYLKSLGYEVVTEIGGDYLLQ